MNLDDATTILARLKAAFPVMSLDEAQAEVLLKEVALLHDPSILDEAVSKLIHEELRFPPIARIRSAYRSVAEASAFQQRALRAAEPDRPQRDIPEWVHVWEWRRKTTQTARQAANDTTAAKVEDRPPVRMRLFPQCAHLAAPGEGVYSLDEYEELRTGWVAAGSPQIGGVSEILEGVGADAPQ